MGEFNVATTVSRLCLCPGMGRNHCRSNSMEMNEKIINFKYFQNPTTQVKRMAYNSQQLIFVASKKSSSRSTSPLLRLQFDCRRNGLNGCVDKNWGHSLFQYRLIPSYQAEYLLHGAEIGRHEPIVRKRCTGGIRV